jgi:hypothetical protein
MNFSTEAVHHEIIAMKITLYQNLQFCRGPVDAVTFYRLHKTFIIRSDMRIKRYTSLI